MRSVIAFDTLAFVRELKESGMDTTEAEGIAKALMSALGQVMEAKEIATRQDLLEMRQDLHGTKIDLEQKISHSASKTKEQVYDGKAELKQDIHDVRQDIKQMELKLTQDIFGLKDAIKSQELHLKSFIVRCFTTSIILIGGIQTIIHLCSKST